MFELDYINTADQGDLCEVGSWPMFLGMTTLNTKPYNEKNYSIV